MAAKISCDMYLKHTDSSPAVKTRPHNMSLFFRQTAEWTPHKERECLGDFLAVMGAEKEQPIILLR